MTIDAPPALGIEPQLRSGIRRDGQREKWIGQHSAFLSAAIANNLDAPRIPRRRVDEGGFAELLAQPGVRALVENWWGRVLEMHSLDG